jgi:hypothetical protein
MSGLVGYEGSDDEHSDSEEVDNSGAILYVLELHIMFF